MEIAIKSLVIFLYFIYVRRKIKFCGKSLLRECAKALLIRITSELIGASGSAPGLVDDQRMTIAFEFEERREGRL